MRYQMMKLDKLIKVQDILGKLKIIKGDQS